jgi:hypothetical protein
MVTKLEMAIGWMLLLLHEKLKKLRRNREVSDLEAILSDRSMKWVRSKSCPAKDKVGFAEAIGWVHGAAHALGIPVGDFVAQLFDQDENDEAQRLGLVAKYSSHARGSDE